MLDQARQLFTPLHFKFVGLHLAVILAFLALGSFYPRRRQGSFTPETIVNLIFMMWQDFVRLLFIAWVASHVPSLVALSGELAARHCPYLIDMSFLEPLPVLQFCVVLLIEDFTMYWIHRAQHRFPIMWAFHKVHHSATYMEASTAERVHPVEDCLQGLVFSLIYGRAMNFNVLITFVVIHWTIGAFRHANIPFSLHHPVLHAWDCFINNPHFHGWHHAIDPKAYNTNYGDMLTIWDRIFGTHLDTREVPLEFGLPPENQLDGSFIGLNLLLPAKKAPLETTAA